MLLSKIMHLEKYLDQSNQILLYSNTDSVRSLCVVRFEKLDLECLHLNERYLEALLMFQDEIEELRDRYNEERQNPLLPRNMPPISGRIMWIRQLYSRIEEPMNIFKTKTKVNHQSGGNTLMYK